jgi:hypothetical protein
LAIKKTGTSDRIISAMLSALWIWNGAVYHISYFSRINKAAYGFGIIFLIGGTLFLYAGVIKPRLSFKLKANAYSYVGLLMILYAMVIYPIIGSLAGHSFPSSPVFGVAPCPTTIFTFGLLLLTEKRVPAYVLAMPVLWALIGTLAAFSLGIREDLGLITSSVVGTSMVLYRQRKKQGSISKSPTLIKAV